jgi:hypothetical protein
MGVSTGKFAPTVPDLCPSFFAPILSQCLSLSAQERPSAEIVLTYFDPLDSN